MPVESKLARMVRGRRLRRIRSGRLARPLGRILLLGAVLLGAAGAAILISPLPLPAPDLQMGSQPEGARFYDRTGKLLIEAGSARAGESRWYAAGSAPETDCVLPAFLAARDLTFGEIRSPDLLGAMRAFAASLAGADDLAADSSAELLAMRGGESTVLDKARLAGALAARFGRLELAEWMINVRLYGNGTVGVDDAALTYFGVHAGALAAAQCAALEALAADPALAGDPALWNESRDALLNRMLSGGFLEKAEWARAVADPIPAAAYEPSMDGGADPVFGGKLPILDSFLELVLERLSARFPQKQLPRSGIRVFTTMDLDFELQLLCAAQNLLAPPEDSSAALPTLEGKPCDMAVLLGPASVSGLPADFALTVIDPVAGEVLAYFSSARGEESVARGPAGTALLPFVYLSAFARGYSPASMLLDIPRSDLSDDPDREFRGPLSARTALQQRVLAAAAGMAASVGSDHIDRSLSLIGLIEEGTAGLALEERLRQPADLTVLTQAYATLAGGGLEAADRGSGAAVVVLRVEQNDGTPLEEYSGRRTRRVFGSDLAYLVQDILSDRSGRADLAAPALAGSRSAVAAMLGEDPDSEGAWAFAFTPGFAAGVRSRAYAAEIADPKAAWILAQAAAGWALRALPVQSWSEPPGIVRRDVCVPSGLLPSRYCPATVSDIFLAGNEPSQTDSFYRPVAVNRETGRLATLWTPLNLIDEKVFFILEGESRIWAERSGFPVPPDTYDTLPDSYPYYEALHISSPSPLSVARGKVVLRGTAAETGMERYLLRAGPGLYPSVWYALGSGIGPVREDVLGEWDTHGADGVWSIQLTAVFTGGKILTVAIPVSLDNTPPSIRWIQPSAPQRISVDRGETVILQVDVTDNLGIEEVEFFLDGKVRTRQERGPFSVRWSGLAAGRHTAKICAKDRIGNETCTQELEVDVGLITSGGLLYNTPGKVKI
ncbi:MAG: transglycosylase domain-containing protein [Anaerolineales bacterium]|nr:transglycosylase domain-containing protein [Anaerolineales bacterium]